MEANFFRFAVDELNSKITGLRIQKVFMPGRGVWTFSFGGPYNLLFFCLPRTGGFFLSRDKPANPAQPSSQAMWLRKRIKNQKIIRCMNFWPWRRAAFELSGTEEFLVLDIRKGISLVRDPGEPEFSLSWPRPEEIELSPEIWKTHPHITPLLRRALSGLPSKEASQLLKDLESGNPPGFYLHEVSKGNRQPGCFPLHDAAGYENFPCALEAARAHGWPIVSAALDDARARTRAVDAEIKRLGKNLDKLRKDKQRLNLMVQMGQSGELIKANLYSLDSGARKEELRLTGADGAEINIRLDPKKTIQQNMVRFFNRAAKGRRGLEFVGKREKELQQKLKNISAGDFIDHVPSSKGSDAAKKVSMTRSAPGCSSFRSSDGFLILRARNRQAGHKLLSTAAAPHDLWFHVQDGPGAHVILKRAHELMQVPEKSMKEAAGLAALASYRKNDLKAAVYCARVKDVRKIKGLQQGMVQADRVLRSITVYIDPDQEGLLKIS
ncbi:MAG: NFACT RNA binding domain-containing protein [Desulfonatronovibrio sp.]